ncbi:MAG: hypothetical protein K8T89_15960 [Planctomycetes bacterium]|nr:hypothetical protein [Planctomycetota bacterium]
MTRYHKALGIFLVSIFGLWGCARGPVTTSASSTANNEKVKTLETRTAKLEEDLKYALATKETLRKKFDESEQTAALLQLEVDRLRSVEQERDTLQAQLRIRTTERDQMTVQYESFRKNIRELLGQAETTLQQGKQPAIGVASSEPTGPVLPGGGF